MNRKKKTNSLEKVRQGPPRAWKPITTSKNIKKKSHLQKKNSATFEPSSSSIRDHGEINNSSQEVSRPGTSNVQDVGEAESSSDLQMNRKKKTNSLRKVRRGPPRACKPITTPTNKNKKSNVQKKNSVTFEPSSSIRDHNDNHSSQEVLRPGTSAVQDVGEAESKSLLHRPQSPTTDMRHSPNSIDFGASQSRHRSTTDNDTHKMPILRSILISKRKITKSRLKKKRSVAFNLSSSSIRDHDEINNHSSQDVLRRGSNAQDVGEYNDTHMMPLLNDQMPRFENHEFDQPECSTRSYRSNLYEMQQNPHNPMPDSENLIYDPSMHIPESNNENFDNMMSFPSNQMLDCENSESGQSGYSTDFYNTHMMPFSYNQMLRSGYCPRPVNMTIGFNNIPFPMAGLFPPLSFRPPARLFEMNQLSANHFFGPPNINEGIFPLMLPRITYARPSDVFMNDDPRSTFFPSLPYIVTQTHDDPSLSNQAFSASTYMPYSRYQ